MSKLDDYLAEVKAREAGLLAYATPKQAHADVEVLLKMVKVFRKYGHHKHCAIVYDGPCDCGYERAEARAEALVPEEKP